MEREVAKDYGGTRNPGSGAYWYSKGDVILKDFLVEVKTTEKKSYSLKRETMDKIELEAAMAGKLPLMVLDLDGKRYVIIKENLFRNLYVTSEETPE